MCAVWVQAAVCLLEVVPSAEVVANCWGNGLSRLEFYLHCPFLHSGTLSEKKTLGLLELSRGG